MEPVKMRTRMLPSMTNHEVELYLERNDIIFIPVGVNEMHGVCPLDVEYVAAEAWARLFAEKVDGLVLPNLVYFYPGGTQTGRGTVTPSISACMAYLLDIMHSLLAQGFRRLILIPAHGPTRGFLAATIQQFFDETHVPPLFLTPHTLFARDGLTKPHNTSAIYSKVDPITKGDVLGANTTNLGCYKICGRLDDVPTGEETEGDPDLWPEGMSFENCEFPEFGEIASLMDGVGMPSPQLYLSPYMHGSPRLPWTREEIEKEAAIGEAYMRDLVDRCSIQRKLEVLRLNVEYVANTVMPAHGDHLRGKRYSPNK